MNKIKLIIVIFVLIFTENLSSQNTYFPLGHDVGIDVNGTINKINKAVNTGFKPLLKSDFQQYANVDSVIYGYARADKFFKKHKTNWFYRKFMFEDFVYIKKKDFRLSVNPLLYVEYGKLQDSISPFMINTRGIELKGDLGKKVSFYSAFYENQASFRPYINNWIAERLVVPGQGATKAYGGNNNHDFSYSTAYLSYSPFKWLNLQTGYDKNFIGEGYRSLLLSDNTYNYPFVKLSANYKGFKYTSLFTKFEDFEIVYYYYHFKKHGAFNYLSYSFNNRVELGLFEGVIYHTTDTTAGYINKIPADYYVPIIGVGAGVNGLNSEHNAMLGANLKVKVNDFIQLYGQTAIDDFKKNKYAWQGGLKIFDIFHSKLKNNQLYLQLEYNTADAQTYYYPELKYQTWSHYNQELAHPLGNSFTEIVIISKYRFHNFFINYKFTSAETNRNGSYSYIFNELETFAELAPTKIGHQVITAGYTINPRYNFQIYGGLDIRTLSHMTTNETQKFMMFGIRTNINNFYYDF